MTQDRLDRFDGKHVLVMGDIMLDHFSHGEVSRVSPEAPVPLLRLHSKVSMPGGAANVARNIVSLGGDCSLVGLVGMDDAAFQLRAQLEKYRGLQPVLINDSVRPTTVKSRFIAQGQHLLRVDEESAFPVDAERALELCEAFDRIVRHCDVVVLSDYAKGVLSDEVLSHVLRVSRQYEKPVIVDPKRRDLSAYAGASVITPNAREMAEACGVDVETDEALTRAADVLLDKLDGSALLVTRSERGMTVIEHAGAAVHIKSAARQVFDVSGAGDTVVATLALALAAGETLVHASGLANEAAGLAVSQVGTAAITQAQLRETLALEDAHTGKIHVSRDTLVQECERLRRRGRQIGFTNGCFDLIHPGHVASLQRAKAECDFLIVALNTDLSVQQLKGPKRPVQNEVARCTVMAALEPVDAVILFDEETPQELIEAIVPDVLMKGADYTEDEVVGAQFVKSRGGRVKLIPLESGHSTTRLISRSHETTSD